MPVGLRVSGGITGTCSHYLLYHVSDRVVPACCVVLKIVLNAMSPQLPASPHACLHRIRENAPPACTPFCGSVGLRYQKTGGRRGRKQERLCKHGAKHPELPAALARGERKPTSRGGPLGHDKLGMMNDALKIAALLLQTIFQLFSLLPIGFVLTN